MSLFFLLLYLLVLGSIVERCLFSHTCFMNSTLHLLNWRSVNIIANQVLIWSFVICVAGALFLSTSPPVMDVEVLLIYFALVVWQNCRIYRVLLLSERRSCGLWTWQESFQRSVLSDFPVELGRSLKIFVRIDILVLQVYIFWPVLALYLVHL